MRNRILFGLFIILITGVFLNSCVKEFKPPPQADFSYIADSSCVLPVTITFENLSQGADIYRWDFGDNSTINYSKNPTHTYTNEGIYTVTLTTYGDGGTDETVMLVYVVTTPVTTFYSNDTIVSTGDLVHFFSNTNSTLPSSWLWSFGDGNTSTLENPVHQYTYPGTYTVVLTATNACGATYTVQSNYISVSQYGAAPIVDFVASNTLINTGTAISFTDLSLNNPQSWSWVFQGGTPGTSQAQHPTNIVYNMPGTYSVKLIASNLGGTDTLVKTGYINVALPNLAPVADFYASATNISVGSSINFTDLSLNNPTSWYWQFQGAIPSTSNAQNPSNITYNVPGSYNVALTATNALGNDVEVKQFYINVTPSVITQVLIKKITVENMPFPTVPPLFINPYYRITNAANIVLKDGRADYLQGIIPSDLPISWDLNPFFQVPAINNQYKIRLFDWKTNQSLDTYISDVVFNLNNYTLPPNAYPPSITIQMNNIKIILDLQWQ